MPKPVSHKNTKQEILDAYEEITQKLQTNGPTPQTTKKLSNANDQIITSLTNTAQTLSKTLAAEIENLAKQFKDATHALEQLSQAQNTQRQMLQNQEEQDQKNRTREQEEYEYEFNRKKKQQTDELEEIKAKAEAELANKKQTLKDQEDELVSLREQAKTFDERIKKEVTQAVEQIKNELTTTYEHEKALATQEHKAIESLLKQKIESLARTITTQSQEIKHLQTQLTQSGQQLTRIAQAAVEKSPTQTPQHQTKE